MDEREELEMAWSEAGDNMRNGVELIKQRDATIDGLREEVEALTAEGIELSRRLTLIKKHGARLAAIEKAVEPIEDEIQEFQKLAEPNKFDVYDSVYISSKVILKLIAAVKGEK